MNSWGLRIVVALLAVGISPSVRSAMAGDAAGDVADREFLRQLTERGFYSLAEQHCRRLLASSATPFDRALWQLRLCRTYEKHAWSSDARSRPGLLNRSINELTEFLNTSAAFPDLDLQARLQVVSTLTQSVRMALIVAEAGRIFGRNSRSQLTWNPATVKAHEAAIDRAAGLTEELQSHLERVRREVDPDRARMLRDQARLAAAELLVLRWRLTAVKPPRSELFRDAEAALTQCQRATRSPELKHKAAWLLAELSLYVGDDETYQLRGRSIFGVRTTDDFLLPVFLDIRNSLFHQDATSALTLAKEARPLTILQKQQLNWLQLESLLGLRELAGTLDDDTLKEDVAARFQALSDTVRQSGTGVFRDAADVTMRRFDLIAEVGVEIADLIEKIERDRAAGNNAEALRVIRTTLQRLPVSGLARSRAFLLLRAGQILVELKEWQNARESLASAAEQFRTADMVPEAAAADLLRIFAMSRMLGRTDGAQSVTEEVYVRELESHLENFSGQPSAETATEWLQKMISVRDPLRAARLLTSQAKAEANPGKKIRQLNDAGNLLHRALQSSNLGDVEQVMSEFEAVVSDIVAARNVFPASDTALPELMQLEFSLMRRDRDQQWPELRETLKRIRRHLVDQDGTLPAPLQHRVTLLEFVLSARSRNDPAELNGLRNSLLAVDESSVRNTILFLDSQTIGESALAGDGIIAQTVGELLTTHLRRQISTFESADILTLLPAALRSAAVTENADPVDSLLDRGLSVSLSDDEMQTISLMLANASVQSAASGASGGQKKFWRKVLSLKPQGSGMWLEASLQLAKMDAASGRISQARRRLGVVETLYPEWGAPDRKQRAAALSRDLKPQNASSQ